jgi:hypothetical protein
MLEPENGSRLRFKTMLRMGTYLEDEAGNPRELYLCDFASAGATWQPDSRYRVWLPLILFPVNKSCEPLE